MARPVLLDLFCGAGGAAKGYHDAGFDVVGVDVAPQPNFPYDFIQADAMEIMQCVTIMGAFAAVHASPPCQAYTSLNNLPNTTGGPDLVMVTRILLQQSGLRYVIENVEGAPMRRPVTLCGSMFDLPIKRHRLFESNVDLQAPKCNHDRWAELWPDGFPVDVSKERLAAGASARARVVSVHGHGGGETKDLETWQWAMGTPWMTKKREIAEAIPPAYTNHLGLQLVAG